MKYVSLSKLYAILIFFVCLTAITYYHRPPGGDDAWFSEQSYWLQKSGVIRSEYFRGIANWENQLLVSHKLFIALGAILSHFLGFQAPVPQFMGLIFFLIIVVEIISYLKSRRPVSNQQLIVTILILVFANRLLIKMSFENRPEMLLAACGFGSFLLLNKSNIRIYQIVFAGLLAGLAFLAHLNGVIYVLAGFGLLLLWKRYRDLCIYTLVCGITCLFYLTDILMVDNGFETWWHQFRNDPATQDAFGLKSKLIQIATYPRLFFHSPEQIALSVVLVHFLWKQRANLGKIPFGLRTYSLLIFVLFWFITKANSALYMPLFMPFMFALVFELFAMDMQFTRSLKLLAGIYFVIGIYGSVQIIHRNLTMDYLPVSYQKLRPNLDSTQVGLVPLTFFFNEYSRYPRLLANENYIIESKKKNMTTDKFATWAKNHGAQFILMDYLFRSEPFYPKAGKKTIPFFKLHFFDGRFAIYKSIIHPHKRRSEP